MPPLSGTQEAHRSTGRLSTSHLTLRRRVGHHGDPSRGPAREACSTQAAGMECLRDGLGHREDVGSGWACLLGLHRILAPGRRRPEGDSECGSGGKSGYKVGGGGTWG